MRILIARYNLYYGVLDSDVDKLIRPKLILKCGSEKYVFDGTAKIAVAKKCVSILVENFPENEPDDLCTFIAIKSPGKMTKYGLFIDEGQFINKPAGTPIYFDENFGWQIKNSAALIDELFSSGSRPTSEKITKTFRIMHGLLAKKCEEFPDSVYVAKKNEIMRSIKTLISEGREFEIDVFKLVESFVETVLKIIDFGSENSNESSDSNDPGESAAVSYPHMTAFAVCYWRYLYDTNDIFAGL